MLAGMEQIDRAELYAKARKKRPGSLWIVGGVGLLLLMIVGFTVGELRSEGHRYF